MLVYSTLLSKINVRICFRHPSGSTDEPGEAGRVPGLHREPGGRGGQEECFLHRGRPVLIVFGTDIQGIGACPAISGLMKCSRLVSIYISVCH